MPEPAPQSHGKPQNQYDIASCPHIAYKTGFTKHMYVKEQPRLVNQIPRGSKRYNQIKEFRSASERSNSTIKKDKKIIDKPRVLNISRANILANMATIVLLLFRAFSFVVRTTCQIKKLLDAKGSLRSKDLLPDIPQINNQAPANTTGVTTKPSLFCCFTKLIFLTKSIDEFLLP